MCWPQELMLVIVLVSCIDKGAPFYYIHWIRSANWIMGSKEPTKRKDSEFLFLECSEDKLEDLK